MKQHPNSGATLWASVPASAMSKDKAVAVVTAPAGQQIYVAITGEDVLPPQASTALSLLEAAVHKGGGTFRVPHVDRWHFREAPGGGGTIGNAPWDRHPAYSGPEDQWAYVFSPQMSDERAKRDAAVPAETRAIFARAPSPPPQTPSTSSRKTARRRV